MKVIGIDDSSKLAAASHGRGALGGCIPQGDGMKLRMMELAV